MLLQSNLPKGVWWKARTAARYVTLCLPTKTYQGYMSPMKCVPGSMVPTHNWIREWGCKAYVLVNRADSRREDLQEKANLWNTSKIPRVGVRVSHPPSW